MPGPHKITLAEAAEQGDVTLTFYCVRPATCWHSGTMPLADAIARWGGGLRLDQVPARCTQCGSRDHVDVRGSRPSQENAGRGGHMPLERSADTPPIDALRYKKRRRRSMHRKKRTDG